MIKYGICGSHGGQDVDIGLLGTNAIATRKTNINNKQVVPH
jgi:hypothetical protein